MSEDHSCNKCTQEDNEEMVQCDKCDRWYHFGCVGVGSDVAERSWSCDCCNQTPPAHIQATNVPTRTENGAPVTSQSSPALGAVGLNEHVEATWPKPAAKTTYPHTYTFPTLGLTGSSSRYLPISSTATNAATTHNLLIGYSSTHSSVTTQDSMPIMTSSTLPKRHLPANSEMYFEHKNDFAVATPGLPTNETSNAQSDIQKSQQMNLQMQRLEEEMRLQQQFIDNKYKILAQIQGGETAPMSLQASLFESSPTSTQLAARQVIPRKLPTFSGDPEDWPLFISSFENSTNTAGFTNAENLSRLQECLKGKARDMVKSKLCLPDMVPEIISTLRMCFGRPEHILERVIYKARSMPAIKDKLESLIDFALSVRNICATMESCHMDTHMHNPLLVKELVDKLPNMHKLSWAMFPKDEKVPIIKLFSDWLYQLGEAASTLVSFNPNKNSASLNTHLTTEDGKSGENTDARSSSKCHVCDGQDHKVPQCEVFKDSTLSQKWDIVPEKNICRQCLCIHRRKCSNEKKCGIDGCPAKHHMLLHKVKPKPESDKPTVSTNANKPEDAQVNAHSRKDSIHHSYFRFIPVSLHAKDKTIKTFAFLDEGSAVTLIERSLFDELEIPGKPHPLCLRWTGDTTRVESDSLTATIEISNVTRGSRFQLRNVHTVESLNLPSQSLDVADVSAKYPFLKGLPLESYTDVKPKILIGVNNWRLAVPLKVKEGKASEVIATKCRLGWTLQGHYTKDDAEYQVNVHVCDCQHRDEQLHEAVKEFFNLEKPKPTQLLSADDDRTMKILNETCRKLENRYEIGLPWRSDPVNLPESYSHAVRRLKCLKKKFTREPALKDTIQAEIDNLVSKGYARKITPEEAAQSKGKIWYLPIFIVKNPNKPGKVRLVWDAAAKTEGASLNDYLLSGPDLLNSLVDVLLAFRVGKIAICGDIAEMFHRINVRESDMHAQRFLWWDTSDQVDHPSSYVMRALTFGLNCAPCIAHFIRDMNAKQFEDEFPRAVEAILKYHYVDDFIDSTDDELSAVLLATQVKRIHSAAGFHIRNWSSNSEMVLSELEADRGVQTSSREWNSTTKVLGMFWDPVNDQFEYICRFARLRRDVLTDSLVPTKREVLQVLMSIFDPLGFISCYTIDLKILLQEIWRSGLEWDQPLSDALHNKWCKWKEVIPVIKNIRIPRCYSLNFAVAGEAQLHTFVDAGENAYSAISYLRIAYNDSVSVALVAAKSKVSPLKPLSIPRLELQAAVIGVKLAAQVLNIQRIHTTSQFYWTDSKTTLKWLHMDPRRLQQFVMHRVGQILEYTDVSQWKWVPSTLNPADLATKRNPRTDRAMWFSGPDFLLHDCRDWPICDATCRIDNEDIELKHCVFFANSSDIRSPDFGYFSCWKRLQKAVAIFILFIKRCIAKAKGAEKPEAVSTEMYETARKFLIKHSQATEFSEEIYNLHRRKSIRNSSKLIPLNVYLDNDGILRSKGRAEQLNNHGDAVILPQNHIITFLIVRWFHKRHHHQMHETIINHIRSRFYIRNLRVLYRHVRQACQACKNNSAMPIVPQMAALPAARLAAFERPFTYTGVVFFGPLFVTVGRRREKRWGVIFTCLTVRAIHIEVAHSLDTSSCVMAITNFISRRGSPRELFSDNGTNFKAAQKILCDNITWKFNPPSSPHMGGAWERLIRSIKNVLRSLCPSMQFNDESLRCALNEIEFLINSRPLTFVPIEPTDDEAITPNHLLIGSSDGYKPIINDDVDLRHRWTQTQKFADKFWRRWLHEYVPIISRRSKWYSKQPPIRVGDVVVIVDPDLPRNCWPKGIVVHTLVAKDGQVRTVTVKTKTSTFQRPVAKVAVLDVGGSKSKLAEAGSFTGEGMLPQSEPFPQSER